MSIDTPTEDRPIESRLRSMPPSELLRRRFSLKKGLSDQPNLISARIAILGGSTTIELKEVLELYLLSHGIRPQFYESAYSRFREEVLIEKKDLWDFQPEIVFIHTNWRNVTGFPNLFETEHKVEEMVQREVDGYTVLWEKINSGLGALVVQNNFDYPSLRPFGNVESSEVYGRLNYLNQLNAAFAAYASKNHRVIINDILYLSARVGLSAWHRSTYWYNFHMAISPEATVAVARNVAEIVKSVYGRTKKCLVLDLDNTLWGGVIGDDGMEGLDLGHGCALGEAFLDFQKYVKELQRRGVILAVCSKNEMASAQEGFSHPDTVLKLEDFGAFKANWNPKPENLREIAAELSLSVDSLVFVDDNPAERALVRRQIPEVATPEVGSDVSRFPEILESEGYFAVHRILEDDMNRSSYYRLNAEREVLQKDFSDYGAYLASLSMSAEIAPFSAVYLDRIAQLTNKTNQFNLTTRRYTSSEIQTIAGDSRYVTLYGRLADKFGDHGLVSVIVARASGRDLMIDAWLMSCRVLNREMELAMFDALVDECQTKGYRRIIGSYIPSKKNGIVADHYRKLGFAESFVDPNGHTTWTFEILSDKHCARAVHIVRSSAVSRVVGEASAKGFNGSHEVSH